jgi:glutamyl-tRNA reductase
MEIFILGTGHQDAPVAIREKLASPGLDRDVLYHLNTEGLLEEALLLTTCNRLEIVGVTLDIQKAQEVLGDHLAQAAGLNREDLASYLHCYKNTEAVRYLFKVASGLDSQVLGEPQILGQVKAAFRQAMIYKTVGPIVAKLFHKSFTTAKRTRSETDLSTGAVSIASAAVDEASNAIGNLDHLKVLVLGAGEMAALVATHLKSREVKELCIINRSPQRALELANRLSVQARPFSELLEVLSSVDLVMTAFGGSDSALTFDYLSPVLKLRKNRLLWIFDLGVPRNVEEKVGQLKGVKLLNIDDFKAVVDCSFKNRLNEAQKAEIIIEEETLKFTHWLSSLSTKPTVKSLVEKVEAARKKELEKTLAHISFSPEQTKALEAMSKALCRKILHHPLAFAKSCHRHGRADFNLNLVRRIFGLDD